MLFTFPSQYWFTIGLSGVFSLTGWSRQIHAEFLVLRATQDTGRPGGEYAYVTLTLCGPAVRPVPLRSPWQLCQSYNPGGAVTPPVWALPRSLAATGGIILLFSFPAATKMFQFTAFASRTCARDGAPSARRVVPFGNPRITGHLHLRAAYRSLSRPSSPPRA